MKQIYRSEQPGSLVMDIRNALGAVTVFRENGAYKLSAAGIPVPGMPMAQVTEDAKLIISMPMKQAFSTAGETRIVIDRQKFREPLFLVVKERTEEKETIEIAPDEETIVLATGDGGYTISTELSADAVQKNEMETQLAALEEALETAMPSAIEAALEVCTQKRERLCEYRSEYTRLMREREACERELSEYEAQIEDKSREIEDKKELIERAKRIKEERDSSYESYFRELRNYMAALEVDEAALRAYSSEDVDKVIEKIAAIKTDIREAETRLKSIVDKSSSEMREIEAKVNTIN